ncbi:MAG: pseudaminic acid cytidylyltransferase [Flavobacteriaceae bacterium]|nr:pseudaminic acid cytidylyltransferase [Flavobacteriaceae bacterium]
MKSIAIIIARGGSKRIFRKNIKLFLGKPIISYSISAALNSKIFDEIMVSTDDNEIAQISKENGAKIPFMRSSKNSTDLSTTADVITEVLDSYKKIGITPIYACCIYPTAPFLDQSILIKAYKLIVKNKSKSVIPVVKYSYPILRSLIIKKNKLEMKWPKNMDVRSQDFPEFYHDAGQFYFLNVKNFLKDPVLFSNFTIPIKIPSILVQDIDNIEDWDIAEFKYKFLKEKNII